MQKFFFPQTRSWNGLFWGLKRFKILLFSQLLSSWFCFPRIIFLQVLAPNSKLFIFYIFDANFGHFSVVAGLVGLCLSYGFALTGIQVFLSRWYSSLANYIVSVERIKQYMHIPPQPPSVIADNRPPPSWPLDGRIQLLDLRVRRLVSWFLP